MKKRIKDLWVKELKSGQWDKTEGFLCHGGDKFCCLGVLTELYIREKNKTRKHKLGWEEGDVVRQHMGSDHLVFKGEEGALTPEVRKWAGMKYPNGVYSNLNPFSKNLAKINDMSKSFEPVIRIIEEHWREL